MIRLTKRFFLENKWQHSMFVLPTRARLLEHTSFNIPKKYSEKLQKAIKVSEVCFCKYVTFISFQTLSVKLIPI